ncbi:hypothetical protein STEG23_018044, partial [Scotinomys teguina]
MVFVCVGSAPLEVFAASASVSFSTTLHSAVLSHRFSTVSQHLNNFYTKDMPKISIYSLINLQRTMEFGR